MPLLEPSNRGLTIAGSLTPDGTSEDDSMIQKAGFGTRWYDRISLARDLSRQMPAVSGSEPVYGIPSISQTVGMCDSRFGPNSRSDMLKTRWGRRRLRRA